MTNEEILAAVARDYHSVEPDSDLANCIRELVARAYEEAAQVADKKTNLMVERWLEREAELRRQEPDGQIPTESAVPLAQRNPHLTAKTIAADIRALKESLAPELAST